MSRIWNGCVGWIWVVKGILSGGRTRNRGVGHKGRHHEWKVVVESIVVLGRGSYESF